MFKVPCKLPILCIIQTKISGNSPKENYQYGNSKAIDKDITDRGMKEGGIVNIK